MEAKSRDRTKSGVLILFAVEDFVGNLLRWIIVITFVAMIAMMLLQVFTRFVLQVSVPWSEELTRYIWVITCFLASGAAVKYDEHIEVNIMVPLMKKIKGDGARRRLVFADDLFRYAVVLAVSIFVAWMCADFVARELAMTTQLTPALHLPKWWIDAAICFSWCTVAFHSAVKIVRIVSEKVSAVRIAREGGEESC